MELFDNVESYDLENVVRDSRAFVKAQNPILPDEDRESYNTRIFWLVNDEIERRILVSGKKRPDYSNQNLFIKYK
jgi:hypothetical protein